MKNKIVSESIIESLKKLKTWWLDDADFLWDLFTEAKDEELKRKLSFLHTDIDNELITPLGILIEEMEGKNE